MSTPGRPRLTETTEGQLNRMFSAWTDAEVKQYFEAVREASIRVEDREVFEVLWREYARRTFNDNVVCKRCGSDNHTAENHPEWC